MEIRQDERSIRFEFQDEDVLYVEWCDGQMRGMREICIPGYRESVRHMLQSLLKEENSQGYCPAQGNSLYVQAESGRNYFIVELAYVPEEDLEPWQWIRVRDYYRPEEYKTLLDSI